MRTYFQERFNDGTVTSTGELALADLVVEDGRVLKDRLGIFPQLGLGDLVTDFIPVDPSNPVGPSPYWHMQKKLLGIEDTSKGQCSKHANLAGASIRCDLALDHTGWAHANREHQLIWES